MSFLPRETIYRMRCRFAIIPLLCLFLCSITFSSCQKTASAGNLGKALAEISSLNDNELSGYLESLERVDPIAPYYQDPSTKEATLQFFTSLTKSENVAKVILENSLKYNVRPSLAFALALEESDFRVDAFNKNGASVDRGLFQLNSKSYPKLEVREFYDPETNARYGIAHLKGCLSEAGNEVAALAMYNAGNNRVTKGATPKKTLNYISRILAYEGNISSLFAAKVMTSPRPEAPGLARLVAESMSMGLIADSTVKKN
jgi:soluble lytic murein transglycosylase-like protein